MVSDYNDEMTRLYKIALSTQNWRMCLNDQGVDNNFINEIQSDTIISFLLGNSGIYRAGMMALRCLLEDCIVMQYFHYHPLEYEKWRKDGYRFTFRELVKKTDLHPVLCAMDDELNLQNDITFEYGYLSKYVHLESYYSLSGENGIQKLRFTKKHYNNFKKHFRKILQIVNIFLMSIYYNEYCSFPIDSKRIIQNSIDSKSQKALIKNIEISDLFLP